MTPGILHLDFMEGGGLNSERWKGEGMDSMEGEGWEVRG